MGVGKWKDDERGLRLRNEWVDSGEGSFPWELRGLNGKKGRIMRTEEFVSYFLEVKGQGTGDGWIAGVKEGLKDGLID